MDRPLRLFQGFGVELEYMIVHRDGLSVYPVSDEVLRSVSGAYDSEVEVGELSWCNEIVLHVIELKTGGPASGLEELPRFFLRDVTRINDFLHERGACLLPTAMHPWMEPGAETRLWPHEYSPVYEAYDRIFGCSGHGWSNLQSLHLNLPFGDDGEFGRLHAAIRLVLPAATGLAASSPIVEGRFTGLMDNRLEVYRRNQAAIPSITGSVIPEAVFDRDDYERTILHRIYDDISPHDPHGILRYEWLNSRGAIARFDRNTIEIRVLDIQESPPADLAIYALLVETLRALTEELWISYGEQRSWQVGPLKALLDRAIRDGDLALIESEPYLGVFGYKGKKPATIGDLWRHVFEDLRARSRLSPVWDEPIEVMLRQGCLARRIVTALAGDLSRSRLLDVYGELARCLAEGRLFTVAS